MHGWNQVYIRYCDGGTYAGRLEKPVARNSTVVHFRGGYILEAIMQDLAKKHVAFNTGSDFVIGGSSAGGLAVYLHLDWWRKALPAESSVVGLADSGFFLDWSASRPSQAKHSYNDDLRWGFRHMNASRGVNAACVAATLGSGGDASDCIFAANVLPHIRTPIFILQSPFDSWQLQWEHGESKIQNYTALNAYGTEVERQLAVASRGKKTIGGFVDHCYHHCTTPDLWSRTPKIRGLTQSTAFSAWYRSGGRSGLLSQNGALPCTSCGCPEGSVGPS
jgi:O-palmitoleoyl-L-serine hydrolase